MTSSHSGLKQLSDYNNHTTRHFPLTSPSCPFLKVYLQNVYNITITCCWSSSKSWSEKETESGVPAAEKLRVMHTHCILLLSWSQLNFAWHLNLHLVLLGMCARWLVLVIRGVWDQDEFSTLNFRLLQPLSVFLDFHYPHEELYSIRKNTVD